MKFIDKLSAPFDAQTPISYADDDHAVIRCQSN